MANPGFDGKAAMGALVFVGWAWRGVWAMILLAVAVFASLWGAGRLEPSASGRPLAMLAVLLAAAAEEGVLYRLALGGARQGQGRAGVPTLAARVLILWGLTGVFLFILSLLAFVVVLAFAFAVATAGHGFLLAEPGTWARAVEPSGRAVVAVVAVFALTGLGWSVLRISLGGAATVARGRVQLLATWPLTRGKVLAILARRLLLEGPPLALAAAVLRWSSVTDAGTWPTRLAAGVAAGLFLAGVWLPAHVGLMSNLYSGAEDPLLPPERR